MRWSKGIPNVRQREPGRTSTRTSHALGTAGVANVADDRPDWERLLAAERHLQALVPGSVLVGGTAAALHAGHRTSLDGDHVIADLRERFDEVLADLEAAAGWHGGEA